MSNITWRPVIRSRFRSGVMVMSSILQPRFGFPPEIRHWHSEAGGVDDERDPSFVLRHGHQRLQLTHYVRVGRVERNPLYVTDGPLAQLFEGPGDVVSAGQGDVIHFRDHDCGGVV